MGQPVTESNLGLRAAAQSRRHGRQRGH